MVKVSILSKIKNWWQSRNWVYAVFCDRELVGIHKSPKNAEKEARRVNGTYIDYKLED